MVKQNSTYNNKIGLPPGSLIYVGKENKQKVTVSELTYSADHCEENILEKPSNCVSWNTPDAVSLVSVFGVHDIAIVEDAGAFFSLDSMILEDVVNTQSRSKMEEFDDFMFLRMKTLSVDINSNEISSEHISLLLGKNGLISFQETDINILENLKDRIRKGRGLIRKRNSDYLFYRIVDTLVDNYFIVEEHLADLLEKLEENILENPHENINEEIYELKKKIVFAKRTISPLRECISNILKSDSGLVSESTQKYFHDVYDHLIHLIDAVDSQRETINDLLNLHMSIINNKMNEVMKVLTIFASIFIPLTFIAGIYGMNFEIMPELHWKYGYFIVWGIMLTVTIILLFYFRRKKWL